MDKTDTRILAELDKDPKIPVSRLAKRLRISQQVADYRIKRMIDNNTLRKIASVINLKALGLEPYRIFFKFNPGGYKTEDIFGYVEKDEGVQWAARVGGKYDMVLSYIVKEMEDLDKFIDRFNERFPGLVKDYKRCYVINHVLYKHKWFHEDRTFIKYGYNDRKAVIDDLDRKILLRVNNDCRISSVQLANELGTTHKTIMNRIKRMEDKKVILGHRLFFAHGTKPAFVVLCSYKNFSRSKEKALIAYLDAAEYVSQSTRLLGVWDLYLNIKADGNEHLQLILAELSGNFDIIDEYEILPLFHTLLPGSLPV